MSNLPSLGVLYARTLKDKGIRIIVSGYMTISTYAAAPRAWREVMRAGRATAAAV